MWSDELVTCVAGFGNEKLTHENFTIFVGWTISLLSSICFSL